MYLLCAWVLEKRSLLGHNGRGTTLSEIDLAKKTRNGYFRQIASLVFNNETGQCLEEEQNL